VINFNEDNWLEFVQFTHDKARRVLDEWITVEPENRLLEDPEFMAAYKRVAEKVLALTEIMLEREFDTDTNLKNAYLLGCLDTEAQIYHSNPTLPVDLPDKIGGFGDALFESFFHAETERVRSYNAIVGRIEQVERTKKANKDFYKKLCDIAEDFLAEGVTHSRTSKKTKDYFDEKGLWFAYVSKPLTVKTVRKILREYQIIPE